MFLARSLQTAANVRMLGSSCLSVRPHVTSKKAFEFISGKFIFGNFPETCFENFQSTRRNLPGHLNPNKTTTITSELYIQQYTLHTAVHSTYNTARVYACNLSEVHRGEGKFLKVPFVLNAFQSQLSW